MYQTVSKMGTTRILWCLVWLFGLTLFACGGDETPTSCDFTEKLVSIAIDENKVLLYDDLLIDAKLEELELVVDEEETQRQEIESLINEARPAGEPFYHHPLSKDGKKALVRIDLLNNLKNSHQSTERQYWLSLYNHLNWGEQITDRAFLQNCEQRVILKPESEAYPPNLLDSHFLQGSVEEISQKDLYHAYSSSEEIQYLNDSENVYRYLGPKTGRGFSTGFFVEDVNQRTEWKVKVGWEAYREPLATRLVWALGFYIDEVFHVRDLRVLFDSELERLFEAKGKKLEDSLSGIVLNDGTFVNLIATPEENVDVSRLYSTHRSNIRYLLVKSVVMERRDPNIVRVGQWGFDALDNPDSRAVRMLGLLNFWLGNVDIKFDNNRIFFRCTDRDTLGLVDVFRACVESGDYEYQFVVHDLGLSFAPNPNELNAPGHELDIRQEENGLASIRFETRGRDVYAWRLITQEDALAFAERLAQLTEIQLRQAAAAAGYPYPALVLLVEKLKDRRNRFLEAMSGDKYVPLDVDLTLSVTSAGSVEVGNGETIVVSQDDFILSEGVLTNDISLGKHGRHSEMIRE